MDKTRILDLETGELLVDYTPGDEKDAAALLTALGDLKRRMSDLAVTRRAVEQAFLEACPSGYRSPDIKATVYINLGQADAQRLVRDGFGQCVGLSESIRYRLQKTEVKKLERLDHDRYEQLMERLQFCTRSIRLEAVSTDEEAEEVE